METTPIEANGSERCAEMAAPIDPSKSMVMISGGARIGRSAVLAAIAGALEGHNYKIVDASPQAQTNASQIDEDDDDPFGKRSEIKLWNAEVDRRKAERKARRGVL